MYHKAFFQDSINERGHGKKEPEAVKEKLYRLRALSAPMYDAKDVSMCEQLDLIPGQVYTFGRSKSTCDIIFQDARVSRRHCQVYVDPGSQRLHLIGGLSSDIHQLILRSGNHKVSKNLENQSRGDFNSQDVNTGLSSHRGGESHRRDTEVPSQGSLNTLSRLLKRAQSSLNGIYVNGCRLNEACKVLSPGDIVSLVAPTKGAISVDPTFGAAIGFSVNERHQVAGPSSHKSLPSPLANVQGDEHLRTTSSEGDKQNDMPYHSSQIILETEEVRASQMKAFFWPLSVHGVGERNRSTKLCTRDSSGNCNKGAGRDLSQAPLADATLLHSDKLPGRRQQAEKVNPLKIRPCESNSVDERGQKRHRIETLVDTETSGRERVVHIGATTHHCNVHEEASSFSSKPQRVSTLVEERRLTGTGEQAVQSLFGINTSLAFKDHIVSNVHNDRGVPKRDLQEEIAKLPLKEQQIMPGVGKRVVEPLVLEKERTSLWESESSSAKARRATIQLCAPPLSTEISDVKTLDPKASSPLPLPCSATDLIYKSAEAIFVSSKHPLKLDTTSMSQMLEEGCDQFCTVFSAKDKPSSLLAEKHETEPHLLNKGASGATALVTTSSSAAYDQSKDRVRSSAEILKLMSREGGRKKLDKPLDFYSEIESPVLNCSTRGIDKAVPQTPEDDIAHSPDRQVDDIVKESPDLRRGDPPHAHWRLGVDVRSEQERRDVKNERAIRSIDFECNLELEEENRLQGTRLLSADGPGIHGFCLNRLKREGADSDGTDGGVLLQELLAPLDEVVEIFAATFTSNIQWFLTSNNLSPALPVTVACHDYVQSWSISPEDRTASPYEEWPNLTVVYPPFPDVLAFSSKSKEGFRRGIGCHHPKLFLIRFYNRLRVVVSSANLNRRQWLRSTNTVWWKDFPQLQTPNYKALFQPFKSSDNALLHTTGDFGAQLAYFISCLLVDVPSKAHWAVDLAHYDFSSAEASLVVSLPGLHGSPYPAISSALLNDLQEGSTASLETGVITPSKSLGVVSTTVVGISYRFAAVADPKGLRVRRLATLLNGISTDEDGMITVFLKRSKNIPADTNAVSVVVGPSNRGSAAQALLQDTGRESSSPSSSQDDCVQLGFLPRNTAKWVAPLCDGGLCTFLARIWPKEALSIASGLSEGFVRLALYVFEGPRFGHLCTSPMTTEQALATCRLLSVLQYSLGLHRLEQVLSSYKWPNSAETDFVFGSSSIGTSLDAPFLAAFSAAAGRRAVASSASEDSDSQWGCWTADHEAENPSIGVVFPTIERAKASTEGPLSHFGVLCFAEKTWERLKPAKLLHDAVPYPATRDGIPMHSKVAMRRFHHHPKGASFGWVYCGSHNFSPAAWGRPLAKAPASAVPILGTPLLISNYELGLIFVEPPPSHLESLDPMDEIRSQGITNSATNVKSKSDSKECDQAGLDRFKLPFVMPPPRYKDTDQPATGKALYRILLELRSQCKSVEEAADLEERVFGDADSESGESEPDEEVPTAMGAQEEEEGLMGGTVPAKLDQQYAEALWSQLGPF